MRLDNCTAIEMRSERTNERGRKGHDEQKSDALVKAETELKVVTLI